MKKILMTVLLCTGIITAFAKDGYRIQVKFSDVKNTTIFLAHYYGKALPTIYVSDSARVDEKGTATFLNNDAIPGGIYMVMLNDRQRYFEVLLNNGDNIGITATAAALPGGVAFTNSPENDRFLQYLSMLKKYNADQQALQAMLPGAKTAADTNALREQAGAKAREVKNYRRDYAAKYKGSLLAAILNGLETPVIPPGDHYLPDGKVDSMYGFYYYRNHYWDNFDLTDDRLVYTPMYEAKLEEYINKLVAPEPDSVQKEADILLAKTRGHKEIFKYTLWWLTQNAQFSKIMGMDQAFVYMVENYYMKGDAYWLEDGMLEEYIDRARKIAPNVIGNIGADIKMVDIDNKEHTLYGLKSKYTLLVFWSPECGGCTKLMPLIDSVYQAELKGRGVKIFAVRTEGDEKMWMDYVKKNHLDDWLHVYDPEKKSNYRSQYDVYGTPVIYLLDDKKIIRGKKIDHINITTVLDLLEGKNTTKKS